MFIQLNECEQKMAVWLARKRYQNARAQGKPNLKMGDQSNEQTDLEGIGAEIAFCKVMNVYPDLEICLTDLPPQDAITRNGTTVDVKATKYRNGRLLVTLKKKIADVDMYVLVTGEFPRYKIVGFMESSEIINEKRIGDLGHGRGYIAEQAELDNEFGGLF